MARPKSIQQSHAIGLNLLRSLSIPRNQREEQTRFILTHGSVCVFNTRMLRRIPAPSKEEQRTQLDPVQQGTCDF